MSWTSPWVQSQLRKGTGPLLATMTGVYSFLLSGRSHRREVQTFHERHSRVLFRPRFAFAPQKGFSVGSLAPHGPKDNLRIEGISPSSSPSGPGLRPDAAKNSNSEVPGCASITMALGCPQGLLSAKVLASDALNFGGTRIVGLCSSRSQPGNSLVWSSLYLQEPTATRGHEWITKP